MPKASEVRDKLRRVARRLGAGEVQRWLLLARRWRDERQQWLAFRRGAVASPPESFKRKVIGEYASRFGVRVFVETGTYLGDTLHAHQKTFDRLISIELGQQLFEDAVRRFRDHKHVELVQGDSAHVLPQVLDRIDRPALFWLDGHYSRGVTARGDKDTPIQEELSAIFDRWVPGHVVLIDDARLFTGHDDYPTIEKLQELVERRQPTLAFDVENDIIRIAPAPLRTARGA